MCESHAKQLGRSREHGPEARIITAPPEPGDNPIKREDQTKTQEVTGTKSNGAAPAESGDSPSKLEHRNKTEEVAATKPNGAASKQPSANTIKREERTKNREVSDTKSNGAAPAEAVGSVTETKAGRATTAAPARSAPRDLTFGNSAKAMVDEAIWNLATGDFEVYRMAVQQGKPAKEAAQAAGGQLAVIHQKIGEYTLKLEAVLSESKATINLGETIDKPLEQATLEAIGNEALSDLEKDSAIQHLGAVQEWVKRGLQGELSPLQANQILVAIGERLNWGGSSDVAEECKPVYRALYGNLKTAVRTAVPEAQNLHERLTNLYAAKSDLDRELLATKELA